MNDKDLKKLKRADLLQILIVQGREIERLEKALEEAENKLKDRTIDIEDLGSMAEAAFKLNQVYDSVDKAAEQYIENVKQRCMEYEKSFKEKLSKKAKKLEKQSD